MIKAYKICVRAGKRWVGPYYGTGGNHAWARKGQSLTFQTGKVVKVKLSRRAVADAKIKAGRDIGRVAFRGNVLIYAGAGHYSDIGKRTVLALDVPGLDYEGNLGVQPAPVESTPPVPAPGTVEPETPADPTLVSNTNPE